MMKLVSFFIFGTIVMTAFGKEDTIDLGMQLLDNKGVAYYDGFEKQRYFPLTEETIEEHNSTRDAYTCEISKSDLLASMLKEQGGSDYAEKYSKYNTRVKVVFSEDDVYLIDKNGMVRHGSNYLKVNKKEFQKRIKCTKLRKPSNKN
jgi:hypothetical protein